MRRLRTLLAAACLPMAFAGSAMAEDRAETAQTGAEAVRASFKAPRTSWGDPDLRGRWPIDYLAQTPRQRPVHFGDRAELTDEEYAAALKSARAQQETYAKEIKVGKMGMGHWTERGLPLRQTSLTTQPANGRMPPMTPEGERRAAQMKSSWTEEHWDWVDDFNTFDRCITRGLPTSMLPGVYNSGIEVYQSPGIVAIRLEMIHETRIVHLNDGKGPPAAVKGWLGYSQGHWEGDTLVIETRNFMPDVPLGTVGANPRPVPNSEAMVMKERLTPTGPDTIRYEAWIEDPVVLTAPFKLDFPWRRNSGYEIFEYACHEGNVQLRGFITSSRAQRAAQLAARLAGAQAAQPAGRPQP